jgi:hypothetical protein
MGETTLGAMLAAEQSVEYWKDRLTESGATNARLRSELDAARSALRASESDLRVLREQLTHERLAAKALAKAVERLADL